MRQFTLVYFLLVACCCCLAIINGKALRKTNNKTELFGQIFGPPGGAVRNLVNLILSINVAYKKHVLHTSIQPITYPLFPLDYAVEIDEKHLPVENIPHLEVMAAIWQPAYVHETVILLTNETVESLNITMQAIHFVIIRGEIVHDKHEKGHDLPGVHVKLELIEVNEHGHIADQVDFICTSTKYPCPFEYWLDTSRIRANTVYQLEGILSANKLISRTSTAKPHNSHLAATKSSSSTSFKINPMIDTEMNNYTIVLVDV